MTDQLELESWVQPRPYFTQEDLDEPDEDEQQLTIQERFELFHQANPHVYSRLKEMARTLKAKNYSKVGMKMLFEVVRWETMLETESGQDPFKLNNDFTSRYARMLMENNPDLDGLFEVRGLKSA